jgi:hypothetical protein
MHKKYVKHLPPIHLCARLGLLLLVGCANEQMTEIAPATTRFEFPTMNMVVEADAGDTVLVSGSILTYPGIELHNTVRGTLRAYPRDGRDIVRSVRSFIRLEPQHLFAKAEDEIWIYYAGRIWLNQDFRDSTKRSKMTFGGLRISKSDPTDIQLWLSNNITVTYPDEAPEFEEATIAATGNSGVARELIFNGRSNDVLQFTYQEHSGLSPEPLIRELVEFAAADNVSVSIKGARMEILEIDGDSMTYRILESFP